MTLRLAGTAALVTGASSGIGAATARRLAEEGASIALVARRRDRLEALAAEIDQVGGNALVVEADVTDRSQAEAAVQQTIERFGRLDILVNNAGLMLLGPVVGADAQEWDRMIAINVQGLLYTTRAVLPVMRKQRSGHVVTLSSMAGLVGQAFCSAYAASKFGVEGWMESIRFEIEPFGIRTTIVEPGFFRTDLLEAASTIWAELSIDDYAERTAQTRPAWQAMSGRQSNDPAKLAKALVKLVDSGQPPLRWIAGADALPTAEQKARDLLGQIEAHRDLSASLTYDDALPTKA